MPTITKPPFQPVTKSLTTEAIGIFPGDVILRTAIMMGLQDLRANTWLLDYVAPALVQDALTSADYGSENQRLKEWFIAADVKVLMGVRPPDGNIHPACITLTPVADREDKVTLADVHYQTREEIDAQSPALTERFHPVSYSAVTGAMKVPDSIVEKLRVFPATMAVVDAKGTAHPIEEVISDTEFKLAAGTVANFNPCFIKPVLPAMIAGIESVICKETWSIGVHVTSEPVYLTYLYSILKFILFRYRQSLLEARGFGESDISAGEVSAMFADDSQPFYSRFLTITGNVRNAWPKAVDARILGTDAQFVVLGTPTVPNESDDALLWVGEQDSLAGVIKYGG